MARSITQRVQLPAGSCYRVYNWAVHACARSLVTTSASVCTLLLSRVVKKHVFLLSVLGGAGQFYIKTGEDGPSRHHVGRPTHRLGASSRSSGYTHRHRTNNYEIRTQASKENDISKSLTRQIKQACWFQILSVILYGKCKNNLHGVSSQRF